MITDYKISLSYDDYFANSNKILSKNIELVGDSITFITNEESVKYLEDNNISYMLHTNSKIKAKKFFINKSGIMIGVILILFSIYLNSFRISEIKFNDNYPINDEVTNYINGQTQELLFFSFHKNNYNDLAKNLRNAFNEYEWISIEKKGSVLNVTIEPSTTKNIVKDDVIIGNIVAKKDGMVESYMAFNGTSIVKDKMYVKKGDILINGKDYNTHAKGYVLATTYETIKIDVLKQETREEYTGKNSGYYGLKLFGINMNIFKKHQFESKDIVEKKVFNIPYLITLNQIEEYEKNGIIYVYNATSAKEYAKSVILDDFSKSKTLNSEEIKRIEVLTVKEMEKHFEVTFLVKKIESIGVFVK